MASHEDDDNPLFSAISTSTRQLFNLLRCVGFASKANVQISERGIQFSVQESQVMQGHVILQKDLFSNYIFHPAAGRDGGADESEQEDSESTLFRISLESFLGTLQIFGVADPNERWSGRDPSYGGVTSSMYRGGPSTAFESRTLGMSGLCKLGYFENGAPFTVTLEEPGVTTTCELTTYEPDPFTAIPIQKDAIQTKIIMRANWLSDAIEELSATSPTRLTILASPTSPHFTLSASGAHGAASVEFSKDPQLLETFQVQQRWVNVYKFAYIRSAARAMAMASKVSIRGDEQGVLSLQFMVEMEDNLISFVDFRFIPFLAEEGDEDEQEDQPGGNSIFSQFES